MFVNQTGRAHVRGIWADLENEVAIRRNVRGKPPIDQYVASDIARELHMLLPTSATLSHETFADTCGYVIVNEPTDGRFRLEWGETATRIAKSYCEMTDNYEKIRRIREQHSHLISCKIWRVELAHPIVAV